MLNNYIFKSLVHALGVLVYVTGVAFFMSHGADIFGHEDTFVIPVFMLLLFLVSASVTGLLVLGRPIYMYLEGQKKSALTFLGATLGWMVLFLVFIALGMFVL